MGGARCARHPHAPPLPVATIITPRTTWVGPQWRCKDMLAARALSCVALSCVCVCVPVRLGLHIGPAAWRGRAAPSVRVAQHRHSPEPAALFMVRACACAHALAPPTDSGTFSPSVPTHTHTHIDKGGRPHARRHAGAHQPSPVAAVVVAKARCRRPRCTGCCGARCCLLRTQSRVTAR
jgi:hypothetical protein